MTRTLHLSLLGCYIGAYAVLVFYGVKALSSLW